jgi:hypothetical protein
MTTEAQREQIERRRVLANDHRVKEQSGTFLSHTHMDEGGRFAQVTNAQVVGADPIPNYPAAAPHQRDPVPIEPPLGYRIDELEPSMAFVEAQAGGPADAPSSTLSPGLPVERTGPSPSSRLRRF